jgi:alanyl-tRNA synthetase
MAYNLPLQLVNITWRLDMNKFMTGAEIRQSFIDYFSQKGHTYVPSSSLVPGGDQTLLFTNAGMVQFKDVFLGEDQRAYSRAANSQKCMRVAGKHNDLDDVGRDDTHHTFFEMLGNWSFGDYYKKEAIAWAWELLTEVWGLEKGNLWATYFEDEIGEIAPDEEAADYWRQQPGINPDQVVSYGREDNFWEMAETGPCGPCSEIHIDLGEEYCDKKGVPDHICSVNGNCPRYLELWNLVFIQYNRLGPSELIPLPACHVDTGMGFERIVSTLQGVSSNYRTDLFKTTLEAIQNLAGHTDQERENNITPYRVIADHCRAATFLIADGVVPGNTGRNYVCRMIIRRGARFGSKIGLRAPFLAEISKKLIEEYGGAYPELPANRDSILENLTREETRFQHTVEAGLSFLNELLAEVTREAGGVLDGTDAFDLYATHGLPFEITRDIAREQGLEVDEDGFRTAMEAHRLVSGGGQAFGPLGGENVEFYRQLYKRLIETGELEAEGVLQNPYGELEVEAKILAIIHNGETAKEIFAGAQAELLLPKTAFYMESGGQVSDEGMIVSAQDAGWKFKVVSIQKPAAGIFVHIGKVISGSINVGDSAIASVDHQRRQDIMRNHTATHLLQAQLQRVLGKQARQAGSLVAPDRLRFDFTNPEAMTLLQLEQVEEGVNSAILENHQLIIETKKLTEAKAQGVTALFGEKYGDIVRTVTIGSQEALSYELCGGTHVDQTGDIGLFLIVSEGSAAAGVRRIEAVTGRKAYELVQKRFKVLHQVCDLLGSRPDEVPEKITGIQKIISQNIKGIAVLRQQIVASEFAESLKNVPEIAGIRILTAVMPGGDMDALRQMTDDFRAKYEKGVVVLGSESNGRPVLLAAVTDSLVKEGFSANDLVREIAPVVGGSGGGRPTLAQAGGKDTSRLSDALMLVEKYVTRVAAGK